MQVFSHTTALGIQDSQLLRIEVKDDFSLCLREQYAIIYGILILDPVEPSAET